MKYNKTENKRLVYLQYCAKVLGTLDVYILLHNAAPSGRRLIGPIFIPEQDNESKHPDRVIKNYLHQQEEQGVLQQMVSDLNIMESVWD